MGHRRVANLVEPHGMHFAVAGAVKVDTDPVPDNPEETPRKAERIRAAVQAVTARIDTTM